MSEKPIAASFAIYRALSSVIELPNRVTGLTLRLTPYAPPQLDITYIPDESESDPIPVTKRFRIVEE